MSEFRTWPEGVPVQIHAMDADPYFTTHLVAAPEPVASVDDPDLFLYPGDQHLFADYSLASCEAASAARLLEPTLAFLEH